MRQTPAAAPEAPRGGRDGGGRFAPREEKGAEAQGGRARAEGEDGRQEGPGRRQILIQGATIQEDGGTRGRRRPRLRHRVRIRRRRRRRRRRKRRPGLLHRRAQDPRAQANDARATRVLAARVRRPRRPRHRAAGLRQDARIPPPGG